MNASVKIDNIIPLHALYEASARRSEIAVDGARRLSRRQRRVLRAVAQALFFDGERAPSPERLDWLARDLDDYYQAISDTTRAVVRLGLGLAQYSPLFMLGRLRRLTSLPLEARVACLQRLDRAQLGPLSLVILALKVLLSATYFEHPQALAETGFDGMAMVGARRDRPLGAL